MAIEVEAFELTKIQRRFFKRGALILRAKPKVFIPVSR